MELIWWLFWRCYRVWSVSRSWWLRRMRYLSCRIWRLRLIWRRRWWGIWWWMVVIFCRVLLRIWSWFVVFYLIWCCIIKLKTLKSMGSMEKMDCSSGLRRPPQVMNMSSWITLQTLGKMEWLFWPLQMHSMEPATTNKKSRDMWMKKVQTAAE